MSRIRADKLVNRSASGAPQLTYGAELPVGYGLTGAGGINVSGVITATSFVGSGANLTGIDATAIKDTDGNVKIQAEASGSVLSGVATAATLNVTNDATVGGALTITGNLQVDGTQTIINTATLEVEDKNIGIASASSKLNNLNLDGAGITIHGSEGDKTLTWNNSNSRMAFSTDLYAPRFYGDGSGLSGVEVGLTTEATVVSGALVTLDLSSAQDHKITATGITTISVSGGTEAESHTLRIVNSGIATVGFSTYFLWPSGATPSLPTANGAISLISFTVHRVGVAGTQLLSGVSVNYS